MQFLNPRTDYAFKKIFGSDHSHDILLSFLNAVLNFKPPYAITSLKIVDPYQAPRIEGMKETFVDVRATDGTGRQFIIEMQVLNVPGFEQRVLYNACKSFSGQIATGEDYTLLCDVIALTITDFNMFPERTEVLTKFKLRADDGKLYGDDLELVFVDLSKFNKTEDALVDVQDKWLYFLRRAKDLTLVPPVLQTEPEIAKAFEIANRAGLSKQEELDQTRREIFVQDMRGMEQIRQRDLVLQAQAQQAEARAQQAEKLAQQAQEELQQAQEELQQAQEEARQVKAQAREHAQQQRLAIAQSLLPVLPDDATIATITGLAITEVSGLRQKQ